MIEYNLLPDGFDKPKVRILVGVSGSGKSTYARQLIESDHQWLRINRDDIRDMMMPPTRPEFFDKKSEEIITQIEKRMIMSAVYRKRNVVVDKTHLSEKFIEQILDWVKYSAGVEFVIFDPNLGNFQPFWDNINYRELHTRPAFCISRTIFESQVQQYNYLRVYSPQLLQARLPEAHHAPCVEAPDPNLINCYLIDLDGVLAFRGERGMFDHMECETDGVYWPMKDLLLRLHHTKRGDFRPVFIVLTARDEMCRFQCTNWLKQHGIPFDKLLMRTNGDHRPGPIVKAELYEAHINGNFNVLGIFEDDSRIVAMWRDKYDLPVFQPTISDND